MSVHLNRSPGRQVASAFNIYNACCTKCRIENNYFHRKHKHLEDKSYRYKNSSYD